MSRLPVALPMMGGPRQQVASKQQQAFEQDTGRIPENIHLVAREAVDASLQVGFLRK